MMQEMLGCVLKVEQEIQLEMKRANDFKEKEKQTKQV
jgi:hypothetical protein